MSKHRRRSRRQPARRKPKAYPRGRLEVAPRGFGFVKTAEGEFFVPAARMNGAMDGDLVEVSRARSRDGAKGGSGRTEGRVRRVLERSHTQLIGIVQNLGAYSVFEPDDMRIPFAFSVEGSGRWELESGTCVRADIVSYPTRGNGGSVNVVEVIAPPGGSASETERIMASYGLSSEFGDEALAQANSASLDVEGALAQGYRDIRERVAFTIDPDDARDFDDAISVEPFHVSMLEGTNPLMISKPGKGQRAKADSSKWKAMPAKRALTDAMDAGKPVFRFGVHIADVSAYVGQSSALDLEARRRATSVYLADRVIPMLPESLSNELCSLKPDEDRLAFTCDMFVGSDGTLYGYEIFPSVIKSKARLAYGQVQRFLEDGDLPESVVLEGELRKRVQDSIANASKIGNARERARMRLGGLGFETDEMKVILDAQGKPEAIELRGKTDATSLIEEAMVWANETVATHLLASKQPCAFRFHDVPPKDSLSSLSDALSNFKWFDKRMLRGTLSGDAHVLQDVLDEASGRAEEDMVTMLVLRSMARAVYSPDHSSHYGLGLDAYCHFTSPIRRYPDLMVHRLLKGALNGDSRAVRKAAEPLKLVCAHASEMERNAEAASFDSQKSYACMYMQDHLLETFDGHVSGVNGAGAFVRLGMGVEGLIPMRCLGSEYFSLDAASQKLTGSDSGKTYQLGDKVRVRLIGVDVRSRRMDFELA